VIHIRYKTLSPGRHAEAEHGTRGVVVYLLPGLTGAQRSAALRRLRQEGSRGCGPRLPAGQLAAALAADWLRVGAGNTGAAVRRHPVGVLLPVLLAAGLLVVVVLVSMPVRSVPELAPGTELAPSTGSDASWPESTPARGPASVPERSVLNPSGPGRSVPYQGPVRPGR
jgi:hypothetical protein